MLKKRTLSVDVSNGESKEVDYVAKLREKYESLDGHVDVGKQAVTKYRLQNLKS